MDVNQSLNTQDILDSIDINMINMNDKKKRGRPKKNNNIINTNLTKIKLDNPVNNNEQEEIILHLPLTKNDILEALKNDKILINGKYYLVPEKKLIQCLSVKAFGEITLTMEQINYTENDNYIRYK